MADPVINAVVDDISARFIDIVIHRIVPFPGKECLSVRGPSDPLPVFDALQAGIFLIVPLVYGLDAFSVHDERMAFISYAGSQIIDPQVNGKCFVFV